MDILKYRYISYLFSLTLIIVSVYYLTAKGLNFSTEFTGGTRIVFKTRLDLEKIKTSVEEITKENFKINEISKDTYSLEIPKSYNPEETEKMKGDLESKLDIYTIDSLEVVQPTIGRELTTKTIIAVVFSVLIIFIYVWYAFRNFLSSISAVLAMLHDTFILVGLFSIFNNFFQAEVDLLFVTAILTILSFSLYDTIVIFDKIREINKRSKTMDQLAIINKAIERTMVRSINNSLTTIIVLFSLALFVQGSLYWFTISLLLGVILGTYSSPFIAAALLYDLGNLTRKTKK